MMETITSWGLIVFMTNYSLVKAIMHVTSLRQAEAIAFFEADVDYIFNSPKSVDIAGVSIDVDRDTASAFSITGDTSKLKDYMILRGYSGSVMEHLGFDIPLGTTTAISCVKAIQIANTQGIPIHKIDSTNINTLLPILQVSSKVKSDIQNAVNAGLEVTVPERNIQYYGWEGVGYIIMDTDTGEAAYRISGGADGAMILVAVGAIALAIKEFTESVALIVEGDTRWWIFETETLLAPEIAGAAVRGAAFIWGYLPIYMAIGRKSGFLENIKNPNVKILYFLGHGWEGGLCLWGGDEVVTKEQIENVSTSHFDYVHLDACHSAGVAGAFVDAKAQLGYNSYYAGPVDFIWFDIPYLLHLCHGNSIKSAKEHALKRHSQQYVLLLRKFALKKQGEAGKIDKFDVRIFGDENLVLKRW